MKKKIGELLFIFYITFFSNIIVAFMMNEDFSYSVVKGLVMSSFGSSITAILKYIMDKEGNKNA